MISLLKAYEGKITNQLLVMMESFYYKNFQDAKAALTADEEQAKTQNIPIETLWRRKLICIKGKHKEYFFLPIADHEDGGREMYRDVVEETEHPDPDDADDEDDDGSLETMDRDTKNFEDSRI